MTLMLLWTLALGSLTQLAASGLKWNGSASMPRGLWLRAGAFDAARHRGRAVLFCPPPTPVFTNAKARGYVPWGTCAGGLSPMLKRAAAVAGDVVGIGAEVRVNGEIIAGSERLARDGMGRPLPTPEGGSVAPGWVWVLSTHHRGSFDSRYAGPIPAGQILGVMKPIWLWE